MPVKRIDHIAVVVPDLEEAQNFFSDALGLPIDKVGEIPAEQVETVFLTVGDTEIELVKPTSDSGGVAKFLAKRGAGMHHVCLEVDDIEGMLESMKAHGIELINAEPVIDETGKKYAFLHPKSTFGVLIEFYEYPA
jgi:methylmalonyl-CoA/ethylmalonyl-CoA epimerase